MFEITITEIMDSGGTAAPLDPPPRIERFKQVVDTIDINAVFKAANGVRRKRRANGKEKAT